MGNLILRGRSAAAVRLVSAIMRPVPGLVASRTGVGGGFRAAAGRTDRTIRTDARNRHYGYTESQRGAAPI